MDRQTFSSDVTREQFEAVRELLEASRRKTRPRKHDLYDVFCGVLYLLHTGSTWRRLPPQFPPWRTVHEFFRQSTVLREDDCSRLESALHKVGREDAVIRLRQLTVRR